MNNLIYATDPEMNINDKNLAFYENLGIDPFQEFAITGGFNSFIDLELIYPYIKNSKSILEIGAGYGRCIDFFLEKGIDAHLLAIEQSPKFFEYLEKKYPDEIKLNKVSLIKGDIKTLHLNQKIDAALWMWSGIIDFSTEEQMNTISLITKNLNQGGSIVVDIPRIGFRTYAEHKDPQNLHLETPYGKLDCYIPNLKDIQLYCANAGLSKITTLDYTTTTDKERTMYILVK